jgi:outer membrane autotransporter protein
MGGFDLGEQEGNSTWIAGVFGGYVVSDLDFDNSTTSVDYRAGLVGGYASYLEGGFFADAKLIAQFGEANYRSVSGIFAGDARTDFTSIGGALEAGYRIAVGDGLFIEPGSSLTYVNSDLDDLPIFGEVIDFSQGESLRGRLGVRIGGSFATDSVKIEPFVGVGVVREFKNENIASVVSNGFELEAEDDIGQTFHEVTVGINAIDLGDTGLSAFVKGNAQFGKNDFENYTGNAGIRWQF